MSVLPELSVHRMSPDDERPELDPTTASIYQSVLENPGVSAEKLAGLLEQSEVTVQFAVEHLVRLDLITYAPDCDGWTAVEPEVGLTALLARQQAELARHQQQVEDSRLTIARLLATCSRRQPHDPAGVEWIVGAAEIRARTATLAADCAEEHLWLRPVERPSAPPVDAAPSVDG